MARPYKEGINYFSHDTDMFSDSKLKILFGRHGLIGYAVFNRLLEMIYAERGYFIVLDDEIKELFILENRIELLEFDKILNTCFQKNLFCQELFKTFKILTSARIQKNFLASCGRRNAVRLFKEFMLIDAEENLPRQNIETVYYSVANNPNLTYAEIDFENSNGNDTSDDDQNDPNCNDQKSDHFDQKSASKIVQNWVTDNGNANGCVVTDDVNSITDDVNSITDDVCTQSKVKESKEKKIRDLYRSKFNQFWNAYNKKVGKELTFKKWDQLTLDEINEILLFVPNYVQATPDQQFRKNPLTFLRQRAWEDEIIERSNHGKNNGTGSKFIDELNEEERQYILRNCSTGQKSN